MRGVSLPWLARPGLPGAAPKPPIREELLSSERLEQHAEGLALQRTSAAGRKGPALSPRVRDNGRILLQCYRMIAAVIRSEGAITPAAEWFVDNFHIVDEVLRDVRNDLPEGFYRQLPKLAEGPFVGRPRVFALAWAFVAHTDSRFDPTALRRFVGAFQRVQPLTIGELWAVPIALRMVLLENLRRLAEHIVTDRAARQEADALTNELLGVDGHTADPMAFRRLEGRVLPTAFAVQVVQRLRDQDPEVTPALAWLNARLSVGESSADEIVHREHQSQGAMNVTVRNIITSMRMMATFDWAEFFERVSLVDATLREGSDFAAMDFGTRDRYRHAIEELARGSDRSELDVARQAVSAARGFARAARRSGAPPGDRREDPGFYLISKGRLLLEEEIDFRPSFGRRVVRSYVATGTLSYLGSIAVLTGLVLALPLAHARASGMTLGWLGLLGLLALVPASDLAIALVNRAVTGLVGPRRLPRLALRDGVPSALRTMVVVPTLLTNEADIVEQANRLEVHYLANPDGDLRFALLSDWVDAPAETLPGDDRLLATALEGIRRLNRQHPLARADGERFFLLHRRRIWNAAEGLWMGWERKRGKLHELNRLLRGAADTTFLVAGAPGAEAAAPVPSGVRYVITLDADTRLPRAAAHQLVGTLAHPLNRPTFDQRVGRVIEGYAVLQPRVTPTLPTEREGSRFQRIFSGPAGIDPYAAAISDVYQDLFGEGSYIGKGIYDVDAFEAALEGRVPENSLLSHDLFEGLFARAALVTDIELFEEFPSSYEVAASRQHRWARGDWQLLPWILKGRAGGAIPTRIPVIARWKMLDNLRRSLSAPTTLLSLLAGWTIPASSPVVWTGFIVVAMALPVLMPAFFELISRRPGVSKRTYARAVARSLALGGSQLASHVTFLAHQAWLMSDAIVRTLVRLALTRRTMLEWVTAARAKAGLGLKLGGMYRRMRGAVMVTVVVAIVVALTAPGRWPLASPFVLLWLLSPLGARWVSRPARTHRDERLLPDEVRTLRSTARRTWRFFETLVGPGDHHLPPDNLQEDPAPVVAHRTSPTNIGLHLLSTVAARDMGWVGTLETVERLEATLASMTRLERFRGHFYNWYETRDLRPLEPRYVSTVDSGNLAGHLLVLGNACREMSERPLVVGEALRGIEDALLLAREAASQLGDDRRSETVTRTHLDDAIAAVATSLAQPPASAAAWAERLRHLGGLADTLVDIARTFAAERGDGEAAGVLVWARATCAAIESHRRDVDMIVPSMRGVEGPLVQLVHDFPEDTRAIQRLFSECPAPAELPDWCDAVMAEIESIRLRLPGDGDPAPIAEILEHFRGSSDAGRVLGRRLAALRRRAREIFDAMEFGFLFDETRKVLSIGYRVNDGSLDPAGYDLLASEARLASFIAIGNGDVPATHWFRLGRPMTPVELGAALVSWSGSMFEYLMPALIMDSPPGSLLDQTARLVVRRQIAYGAAHGVPWGISESAYNVRDLELTYQYSSFGVPGLGLERGLSEDLVIAPYATGLAAMFDAGAAARNFRELSRAGAMGSLGFYEALDYTPTRLPEGAKVAVVRAYMAHHQGMTLVALTNVLRAGAMRARFHAEPLVQATELLLQERAPRSVVVTRPRVDEVGAPAHVREFVEPVFRQVTSPHDSTPRTHLLSNGRYAVMLTAAGSGYSQCAGLAVTRWREDVTRDHWGSYVFLRDTQSGAVWSATYQPVAVEADSYEATFLEDRAEFHRRDGTVTTTLEVLVSPEDDAEIRRVTLTNLGTQTREIELTSYAELVLAPAASDAAHPAFSNLFIQTESVPERDTLLATRRPRAAGDPQGWAAHVAIVEGQRGGGAQYETDRARFLGRCRGIRNPMSVVDGRPLSNTVGSVLDPIFSLRRRVHLAAGSSARVVFSTMVASSREQALALADKYRDPATWERATTLAWTQAQVQLHHLGVEPSEAHLFQHLANRILYSDPTLRPSPDVLRRNVAGPAALWPHGISGDLPIVLVRIDEPEDAGIVRQLLRAHEYWRLKGLAVDLVILNEKATSYAQELQVALEALVRTSQSAVRHEDAARGNVFILRADIVSARDRDLLQTAARAVLLSRHGSLADQVLRAQRSEPALLPPSRRTVPPPLSLDVPRSRPELEFFNGLGGFADDGREYVTVLGEGQWTPAPWINVIANPRFGFQVSESGAGYTWSGNSRENQLTPWSNDPVGDTPGEALYVRDEETGALWGPTLLPIREAARPYVVRHGQGYSRFEHTSHGIVLDLLQFVPLEDPVKVSRLRIENRSGRPRRLSVTAYVEWVLGVSRSAAAPFVVTDVDADTGAILARNPWNIDFGDRVAFADLGGSQTAWTCDRREVLGRNGSLESPAALERGTRLSGRAGAGLDPCAALQATFELPVGGSTEIVFLLGEAATRAEARALVVRYRTADLDRTLDEVTTRWDDILGAVQVTTPDRSLDLLVNRWLLYQTLACRVWARSAFYQAGGAYGFRDQLQDVMALATARGDVTREHLLRAAARQFVEGDVQHWWHPPSGRGVRTRISDDGIWLPYAVLHYLEATADVAVLDEIVPFLDGAPLEPDQAESYFQPGASSQSGTLFEHCARALDRGLAVGAHGLPLIGTGDWNDGMNRVGHQGRGESVWLGWFLHATVPGFSRWAEVRGEHERAARWRRHLTTVQAALEREAWDGDWYRRAYFDDGTPLGSAKSAECRIDSIAQSWAVLSRAADPARAARAMAAVDEYLVRRDQELVLLFSPPFDLGSLEPGYIKGYPPGVRENGGQYSHAAIWAVMAFAALGDGDKAGELFSILNPVNRASTRAGVYRYKVEPYVVAADVYAAPPHVGRGGWTWYTGSAGWMYRAAIESILGFRLRGAALHLDPCIPRAWRSYDITFRYHSARYAVRVENPHRATRGISTVEVDGVPWVLGREGIRLADDGMTHQVRVILGEDPGTIR
ncbi:MAG: glucoamylase family protein [Candidatus Binatia bacterium]